MGIRHRHAAFNEPVLIKGFRPDAPDVPQEHRVLHLGRFEPTRSVRRPWAYVIDRGRANVITKLQEHGIEVEPFAGTVTVEVYTVTDHRRQQDPFQGHHHVTLEADASIRRRTFQDAALVRTAQPLGTLAVYLLEPESADGLAAWNFFDDGLAIDAEFPVYRVRSAQDAPTLP